MTLADELEADATALQKASRHNQVYVANYYTMFKAATQLRAMEWVSVEEWPERHKHYWCLNRDGYQFEGAPCYGMHGTKSKRF